MYLQLINHLLTNFWHYGSFIPKDCKDFLDFVFQKSTVDSDLIIKPLINVLLAFTMPDLMPY